MQAQRLAYKEGVGCTWFLLEWCGRRETAWLPVMRWLPTISWCTTCQEVEICQTLMAQRSGLVPA